MKTISISGMGYDDITYANVYRDLYGEDEPGQFDPPMLRAEVVRREVQRRKEAFALRSLIRMALKYGNANEVAEVLA